MVRLVLRSDRLVHAKRMMISERFVHSERVVHTSSEHMVNWGRVLHMMLQS